MDLMELTLWNASRANVDASGAGAKIPWDEPDFSLRMLEQHLNQEHDWASRRGPIIAAHAAWIAEQLSVPSRILDMGLAVRACIPRPWPNGDISASAWTFRPPP